MTVETVAGALDGRKAGSGWAARHPTFLIRHAADDDLPEEPQGAALKPKGDLS